MSSCLPNISNMILKSLCEKYKTDKSCGGEIIKICLNFEIFKRKLKNKYKEEHEQLEFPNVTIEKITDTLVHLYYWPFRYYDDGPTCLFVKFDEFENFDAEQYERDLKEEKISELERELEKVQEKIDKLKH